MGDGPGHLFVVHSDLARLACDEVLLPTDESLYTTSHWDEFRPRRATAPAGWSSQGGRVTGPWPVGERSVRLVNTGTIPEEAKPEWLAEGVRQGLRAVAEGLDGRTSPRFDRARPLVGMPVFGVGAGGYADVRGAAIDAQLREAEEAAQAFGFDVAVVCWQRADYAAVQSLRTHATWGDLDCALIDTADRLGRMVSGGELALFLGAGVSAGAGLPDWEELISRLSAETGEYSNRIDELQELNPPDAAALLFEALGKAQYTNLLRDLLKRDEHALSHALLASLRVDQAVTTNFDDLYEKAAQVPFGARGLRVVPWDRVVPGQPWLVKIHGDVERGSVVLSLDDFLRYDAQSRPLASIVQTLLMTRHVLFVGYSLTDENFVRLARDVRQLLRRVGVNSMVGTVLSLFPSMRSALWKGDVDYVYLSEAAEPDTKAPTARRLEIFLDRVASTAAAEEASYLLDDRYKALVLPEDGDIIHRLQALTPVVEKADYRRWGALRDTLRSYGLQVGD